MPVEIQELHMHTHDGQSSDLMVVGPRLNRFDAAAERTKVNIRCLTAAALLNL